MAKKPTEHKSVQAQILKYASEIGWDIVCRTEAEERRGFYPENAIKEEDYSFSIAADPAEEYSVRTKNASLYFDNVLSEKIKEFNPGYTEEPSQLIEKFNLLKSNIYGNKDFLNYLREKGTFYYPPEKRELNIKLIDYENPANNIYEVTEEYYYFNGSYGIGEDVVFLINGILSL